MRIFLTKTIADSIQPELNRQGYGRPLRIGISIVMAIVLCITAITPTGCTKSTAPDTSATITVSSLSPTSGPPGTTISFSMTTKGIDTALVAVRFNDQELPFLSGEEIGQYQTVIPCLQPGTYPFQVVNRSDPRIASESFNIQIQASQHPGPAGTVTGETVTEILRFGGICRDQLLPALVLDGLLTEQQARDVKNTLTLYANMLTSVQQDVQQLPDSIKDQLDALLYNGGVPELMLKASQSATACGTMGPFSDFRLKVAMDAMSAVLTAANRIVWLAGILTAAPSGGSSAAIMMFISTSIVVFDNFIDMLPTDLDSLWVSPESGNAYIRGDSLSVRIMGRFVPQSNPIAATFDIALSVFMGFAKGLDSDAKTKAVLKLAEILGRFGLSMGNQIVLVDFQQWYQDNVYRDYQIDPRYYSGGLSSCLAALTELFGLSISNPEKLSFFSRISALVPHTTDPSVAIFHPSSGYLCFLKAGSTTLTYNGYRFKKLSGGVMAALVNAIVGLDFPIMLDNSSVKQFAFIVTDGATDRIPPSAVTDLRATDSTAGSVTLTWTAPGDDGDFGTAIQYDIRHSTSLITDANWATAVQVVSEPIPQPAGTSESLNITGLAPGTEYYFALKAVDDTSNWSELSNILRVVTQADPGGGLVAFYAFSGDAADLSGAHNNGVVNGATLTKDRWLRENNAYYFNGSSSYISVPDSPSLRFTGDVSISVWVNFAIGGSYNPRILSKGYSEGFEIGTIGTDSLRNVIWTKPGSMIQTTTKLRHNSWHHIVCVYGKSGRLSSIYVDGILNIQSSSWAPSSSSAKMIIGRSTNLNSADNFKGAIDDIRIYSRTLSEQEVQSLFHEGGWQE